MRRPTGFDGPRRSAPDAASGVRSDRERRRPAPPERSASDLPSGSASTGSASNGSAPASEPEAITEPIDLVSSRAEGAPTEPGSASPVARSARSREHGIGGVWRSAWASSRSSISAQWRRARRARRRVERREIRRFTERARRRRRVWLVSASSLVVVVAIVAGVAVSPLLSLKHIVVSGADRVDDSALVSDLSGLTGTPLALIDYDAVDRAVSDLRLVSSYSTETKPPDTLVIHLTERVPVASIVHGSQYQLVDAAGVVLRSSRTRPDGFPLVKAKKAEGFDAAVAVLRALPDSVLTDVSTVSASSTDDVTLQIAGDHEVVWGGPEHAELKASVLASLLTATGSEADVYDVSSPHTPVTR